MNGYANLVLILAGVFLAGYTAFFARHAPPRAQSGLLGVALGGAILILLRVPLAPSPGGSLASGGYAILGAGAAILALLHEIRASGPTCPAPRRVGIAASTSVIASAMLISWVAANAAA